MNPYFVIYFRDSWIPAYRQVSECLFFKKAPAIAPVLISVGWPPFDANRNPAKKFSQGSLAESSIPKYGSCMELDSPMELIIVNLMSDLRKLYLPLRKLLLLPSRGSALKTRK